MSIVQRRVIVRTQQDDKLTTNEAIFITRVSNSDSLNWADQNVLRPTALTKEAG